VTGKSRGKPRILVFSTVSISDPGIDMAGSAHMDYPSTVEVISLPCSSSIRPDWILYALEKGFDGVFIAADGGDCPYHPDCTTLTGKIVQRAQEMMREKGVDPGRLKMAAICSVCSEAFVSHVKKLSEQLEN